MARFLLLIDSSFPSFPTTHLLKYSAHEPGQLLEKLEERYWLEVIEIATILGGKKPLILKKSEVGLALGTTEVGDIICVLLGCCCPVNDNFKLVSFAKVAGFMDGEEMEGLREGRYKLQDFTIV